MVEAPAAPPESPPAPVAFTGNVDDLGQVWAALLRATAGNRVLATLLVDARPLSLSGHVLVVSIDATMKPALRARVGEAEAVLAKLRGRATRLMIDEGIDTGAGEPALPPAMPTADHPLVKQAIDALGARVMGVYPRVNRTEA